VKAFHEGTNSGVLLAGYMMSYATRRERVSLSTVRKVIPAAVADMYRFSEANNPSRHPLVKAVKEAARHHCKASRSKKPITVRMLRKLAAGVEGRFCSVRNVFMMILMMAGLMRESEVVGIKFNDIWIKKVRTSAGIREVLVVLLEKRKNDKERRGHTIVIGRAPVRALCPLAWFKQYLRWRSKDSVYLFHADRSTRKLAKGAPNRIVKNMLRSIGIDPAQYGSHSCRRGGATAAAARGIDIGLLKKHGGWRSDVVYLYIDASVEQMLTVSKSILSR
jgi:integrase